MKPSFIVKQLDQYVIGQEAAKKILAVAVYSHYRRIARPQRESAMMAKSNVLLIGSSGTGKTLMCETLSTLLDWQQGSNIMNLTRSNYDGNGNSPDPEAAKQRLAMFAAGDPRVYIEDASFLKVREVSISYDLPKRLASQLGPLHSLQLSLSGRNLLTFTHYSGLDPEVSNFGTQSIARNSDVTPYPSSRSFWFSITAGI